MRVGLFMPLRVSERVPVEAYERDKEKLEKYCKTYRLDILVLPEGYIRRELGYVEEAWDFARRFSHYLYDETGVDVVLGVGLGYGKMEKRRTIECLYILFSGKEYFYLKHSYTYRSAVDFPDWLTNFKKYMIEPLKKDGIRIGFSLCYDMYVPFIFMYYKNKIDLYINPSYSNAKYNKWAAVLQGRAVENRMYTVCTLHYHCNRAGKGFVFCYDMFGNPVFMHRCSSYNMYRPYDTGGRPGLYYFTIDPDYVQQRKALDIFEVPNEEVKEDDYNFPTLSLSEGSLVRVRNNLIEIKEDEAELNIIYLDKDEFFTPGYATVKALRVHEDYQEGKIVYIIKGVGRLNRVHLKLLRRLLRVRCLENRATFVIVTEDDYVTAAQPVSLTFQPKDSPFMKYRTTIDVRFSRGPASLLESAFERKGRVLKVKQLLLNLQKS